MKYPGSIKIHSKEEAEKLLELYNPLLKQAEEKYLHLKDTVETLKAVLEGNNQHSTPSNKTVSSFIWDVNSWADRALLALKIAGKESLSRDLVKIILENEPHIKKQTAEKSLSSALYSLEKHGKIIRVDDDNNRKLIRLPGWKW